MPTDHPDYYTSIVMHGKYGVTYVPVAVDADGNILGLLQGQYNSTPIPIAVDADGVMKANLVAQELTRAIFKLSNGGAQQSTYSGTPAQDDWVDLISIAGEGIIYGGWLECGNTVSSINDTIRLTVDGNTLFSQQWQHIHRAGLDGKSDVPFKITRYDDLWFFYALSFERGVTFESTFVLAYYRSAAAIKNVTARINYALVT